MIRMLNKTLGSLRLLLQMHHTLLTLPNFASLISFQMMDMRALSSKLLSQKKGNRSFSVKDPWFEVRDSGVTGRKG